MRATSGFAAGRIAAIGRLASAAARRTVDAGGHGRGAGVHRHAGAVGPQHPGQPAACPRRSSRGSPPRSPARAARPAPLNDSIVAADRADYEHYQLTPDWRTLGEYFARLEKQGIGINLAQLRRRDAGAPDGAGRRGPAADAGGAGADEGAGARRHARGRGRRLSTSLQYPPAPYAQTEELIALAAEAAKLGGVYATHMRSEGAEIDAALDEAIRIGREAQIPVEIWHLKVAGKRTGAGCRRSSPRSTRRARPGVDIAADTYAYPAWFNSMSAFVPPWAHDGGDGQAGRAAQGPGRPPPHPPGHADAGRGLGQRVAGDSRAVEAVLIGVVQNPALEPYRGRRWRRSRRCGTPTRSTPCSTCWSRTQAYTYVAVFGMSEPDVTLALKQPWVSIDNDSQGTAPDGLLGKEHPHPRAYGTFPRILQEVRARGAAAHAGGRDPQVHARCRRSACASATAACSRSACGRTWWSSTPTTVRDRATFAEPNQLVGGDAVGAGERRPGHRGRQGDRRAAGAGAAGAGVAGAVGGGRRSDGRTVGRRAGGDAEPPPSSRAKRGIYSRRASTPSRPRSLAALGMTGCPSAPARLRPPPSASAYPSPSPTDTFSYARRRHLRNRPAADRAGAHARRRARGGDAGQPRRLPLRRHHRPRDRPARAPAVRLGAAAVRHRVPGAGPPRRDPGPARRPRVPHHQDHGRAVLRRAEPAAGHPAAGADRGDADRGHPGGERPAGAGAQRGGVRLPAAAQPVLPARHRDGHRPARGGRRRCATTSAGPRSC